MAVCGSCGKRDASVEEIRACYASKGEITPGVYKHWHRKLSQHFYYVVIPSPKLAGRLLCREINPHCEVCHVHAEKHSRVPTPVCKRLVVSTARAPWILRNLRPAERLTREQAAELGKLWGVCTSCAALLTRPDSIERGMGPVCFDKYGTGGAA